MAKIQHDSRELQFKIVYVGATGAGKKSNLQYIHRRLDPHLRSDLFTKPDSGEEHCAFDYLPVHATEIPGYRTRFRLVAANSEGIPADADGVVFVSDSDPDRVKDNVDVHHALHKTVENLGRSIPIIYQYNKRDLRSAVRPEILDEVYGVSSPSFLSCALSGCQVFATLDHLADRVIARFGGSDVVCSARLDAEVAVGKA